MPTELFCSYILWQVCTPCYLWPANFIFNSIPMPVLVLTWIYKPNRVKMAVRIEPEASFVLL
jgi:hypothetical protein